MTQYEWNQPLPITPDNHDIVGPRFDQLVDTAQVTAIYILNIQTNQVGPIVFIVAKGWQLVTRDIYLLSTEGCGSLRRINPLQPGQDILAFVGFLNDPALT